MGPKYAHLLSPLKIRNFVLKNRLSASNSLPHFLQGPEPYPADSVIAHYENKAKSAAIVTCMGINNFTRGKQLPMHLDFGHFPDYDLYDTNCQNYLLQLADAIHYYDSIACMGLFVGPPSAYPLMKAKASAGGPPPMQPKVSLFEQTTFHAAPPPAEFDLEMIPAHEPCEWYSEEQLDKIADSYAEQASLLQMLDFDMVSIHMCYRANLPARMMSPITNHREDQWGGSLENRMRFPLMVLERVRQKVGPNFLIEIQWSAEDLDGGYSLDDTVTFLNEAKKYIDIVQLRGPEADHSHPISFNLEETPFLENAAYVKARVKGLVVATIGGYHYLDTCEKALADGKADLIYAARAFISNPDYGQLLLEGRADDVVPCLRCNKCHGRGEHDPFVSVCSVNPIIGLEHKIDRMSIPTRGGKRVAIIGGGPAGMRCAMYLQDRGHVPTIFEASDSLGGAIRHADYADFKWTLRDFNHYLIRQMHKRGIDVRLNTPATPEMIAAEGFDTVVAALGAVSVKPPIPGLDEGAFTFAPDTFFHPEDTGEQVVIIGGGEVGVEAGINLARRGHKVTVLEMRGRLAADSTAIHYYSMFKEAWENEPNFTGITSAKVTRVEDGQVFYLDGQGTEHGIPADTVVVSAGMKPLKDQALAFYGAAPEFYMIGDCKKPATIQQAMRAAYAVAHRI